MEKWYMYFFWTKSEKVSPSLCSTYPIGGEAIQQGSRCGEYIYQLPIPRVGERVKVKESKGFGLVDAVEYDYENQQVTIYLKDL
jgi:hypothetical protein